MNKNKMLKMKKIDEQEKKKEIEKKQNNREMLLRLRK